MGGEHEATNCTSSVGLTKQSAMFILKTRDGRRLTQAATDNILRDVTELFQSRLETVCHNTVETLKDAGVDDSTISTVKDSILAQCKPFKGLETEYHQNAYIRDHFGLIVSILCQSSYRWQRQTYVMRNVFIFNCIHCTFHALINACT